MMTLGLELYGVFGTLADHSLSHDTQGMDTVVF